MKIENLVLLLSALIVVLPAWGENAAPPSLGIAIEVKGKVEDVSALVVKLKKAPAYKAATCEAANKLEADVMIVCAKADGRLMAFLDKNAPGTVQWSISSAGERPCPGTPGCAVMHCPPPGGPIMCCNQTTLQAC